MSKRIFSSVLLACATSFIFLLTGTNAHAGEKLLKLEVQLVFGSNEPQTNSQPAAPAVEKKLKKLPLKWSRYFVISDQQFALANNETRQLALGGSVMIVKNLGKERVELTILERGKITQSLGKGQSLVTNVRDENSFVVLRQAD